MIAWCNRPVEEASWETYDLVDEQFPEFRLEDKAFYREGSNDKDQLKVSWEYFFEQLCLSYEVTKFLHDDLNVTESSTVTPLIPDEIKVDKVILSWIFTTTAKAAWNLLTDIVKDNKRSCTFALKVELPSIKHGTLSIEAYFQKIDSLVIILTSLGSIVNDEDVVHYAVEGLPEKYNQVCGYMHYQDTFPDLKKVRSLLITEEMRLKSKDDALLMDSSSPMDLMTESGNPRRSSSTPQVKPWKPCFHCCTPEIIGDSILNNDGCVKDCMEKNLDDDAEKDIEDCYKNVTEKCEVVNNNMSNNVEGEILEEHFDGDRRNDTIEDNADVNPLTNIYLDVNQNTSIPEVVEDLSSLDRSSDKAERLAHHNNGLDDLDISLRNRLLHQDKCRVRPVAAVNDSSIVSSSTSPSTVLNLSEESCSTWLDYVGPLISDELDSEKPWSYRDPDGNVQGSFSLTQLPRDGTAEDTSDISLDIKRTHEMIDEFKKNLEEAHESLSQLKGINAEVDVSLNRVTTTSAQLAEQSKSYI
nr:hybrid signal transduction histidine kinase M [Tanacetum cinerariifolium]